MVVISEWMEKLQEALLKEFDARLVYLGLQGSYRRGEADEASDIDCMVLLDRLSAGDLERYRSVISGMEEAEKACGFIGGVEELKNWPKQELFLLVHETKDCYGQLKKWIPKYNRSDIADYVRINTANLYHALCHGYLYGGGYTKEHIKSCYKPVFYILQNLHYLHTGEFIGTKAGLLSGLSGDNFAVLDTAMRFRRGEAIDLRESYALLLSWCQTVLKEL